MYAYNPAPAEEALLALIEHRESGGNPKAANPRSSARGLFQFITSTWQGLSKLTGVDVSNYPTADTAPPEFQRINALLLLRQEGPNSSASWQASGPYPTYTEVKLMLAAVGIASA